MQYDSTKYLIEAADYFNRNSIDFKDFITIINGFLIKPWSIESSSRYLSLDFQGYNIDGTFNADFDRRSIMIKGKCQDDNEKACYYFKLSYYPYNTPSTNDCIIKVTVIPYGASLHDGIYYFSLHERGRIRDNVKIGVFHGYDEDVLQSLMSHLQTYDGRILLDIEEEYLLEHGFSPDYVNSELTTLPDKHSAIKRNNSEYLYIDINEFLNNIRYDTVRDLISKNVPSNNKKYSKTSFFVDKI